VLRTGRNNDRVGEIVCCQNIFSFLCGGVGLHAQTSVKLHFQGMDVGLLFLFTRPPYPKEISQIPGINLNAFFTVYKCNDKRDISYPGFLE
jgi:hypothetical protein